MESSSKELFRYAKIVPNIIIDIEKRLNKFELGVNLLAKTGKEKIKEANRIRKSKEYVTSLNKLSYDYFTQLKINTVPKDKLPCKSCIDDLQDFDSRTPAQSNKYKSDFRDVTLSLKAAIILQDTKEVERLSKLLQFIELYPSLDQVDSPITYAPIVTNRFSLPNNLQKEKEEIEPQKTTTPVNTIESKQVLTIWNAANRYQQDKEEELLAEIDLLEKELSKIKKSKLPAKSQTAKVTTKTTKAGLSTKNKKIVEENNKARKVLKSKLKDLKYKSTLELIAYMSTDKKHLESRKNIDAILNTLGDTNQLKDTYGDFCNWFRKAKEKEVTKTSTHSDCNFEIYDPCLKKIGSDRHQLSGSDEVRLLGEAELIVVEENWIKYTPGEISTIETVLKNEKRVKTVTTEKIFEEFTENSTEETTQQESESLITTNNELSSQIDNELNTRFDSDINSTVSGSGGGSIGVVDFSGEGSLGTSVGIGIDSSMRTSDSSNFSNEIINKALEKTKKVTREKRTSRTFRKYETNHTHEIDNTESNSQHINGIYCYLDKHICITERQYGIRQFLIADIINPGKAILKKEMGRHILNLHDIGLPPVFDISPSDIDEYNYLSLVGKYRAANVTPPPPIVKMVSKTYKTDTSNENKEQGENKLKKVVDVLVPFFGKYKRFLIQENIEIPEGYIVQEVHITVTHGSNGISIPAHLPFSLGGALLYAMPKLAVSAIPPYALFYLPIALSEILYLASPVLHYNSDSSNVTINIGHQTKESPYFFFQPEELMQKVFDLVAGFPGLSDNVITRIGNLMETFLSDMPTVIEEQIVEGVQETYNGLVEKLKELVNIVSLIAKPIFQLSPHTPAELQLITDFFTTNFQGFIGAFSATNIDVNLIFKPLKDLINAVKEIVENELATSFQEELSNLLSLFENSDYRRFSNLMTYTGSLPVSFNCVALKPGITINLTACMLRVDDQALDAWRMDTFNQLNQAYFQLEAEYESKMLMTSQQNSFRASPAIMREEEQKVIKDRVFNALNKIHADPSNPRSSISRDQYKLFEHAIDWKNISYRLYNYGPKGNELVNEKIGLYKTADERRKNFMNALWGQVLIPLKENELLESHIMGYIQSGEVKTLDDLIELNARPDGQIDEIAAIYRDIILRRQQLSKEPIETHRREIIPTELMVIVENLPTNTTNCNLEEV